MADESEAELQASSRDGAVSRVIGALTSPRATFESIARRPDWLLPLLLLMVVGFALIFSYGHQVGWRGFIEAQLRSSPRIAQLSPQQQEQAINRTTALAPVIAYADTTVGLVLLMMAIAGIFLAGFNIVFGTKIRFKQSFAVMAYGFLPRVVKGILAVIVIWVHPPEGINPQNIVMSNVGAFLSAGAAAWLRVLGSSIDVFTFWAMALLAIGFAAADSSKKVTVKSAFTLVFAFWLVFLLIVVGFTAVFS